MQPPAPFRQDDRHQDSWLCRPPQAFGLSSELTSHVCVGWWNKQLPGHESPPAALTPCNPPDPLQLLFSRYLGITRPLTYPVRQNGKLMAKMVFIVWLLSASITLPPLFGWAKNVTVERVCLISQDFGYTVYSTGVAFYIPMAVMLVMYRRIYKAAKDSAEKHRFMNLPRHYEEEGVYCLETASRGQRSSRRAKAAEECATLSKLLRQERKNISIFKREQKAARTLGIIVGAFTFCWLPFFLMSTARPFICGIHCSCLPLRLERTLLWLGYTNSLINPLIYAFFNRDLRTTFWNLLRCRYRNINRRLSAASMHEALKATERHECIL